MAHSFSALLVSFLVGIAMVSGRRHYHGLHSGALDSLWNYDTFGYGPDNPIRPIYGPNGPVYPLGQITPRRFSLLDEMYGPSMSGRSLMVPCWRPTFQYDPGCIMLRKHGYII